MLGEFEEDLKGFDVTKPFVIRKRPLRFPLIAKSPQPAATKLADFKANAPSTNLHLLDFDSFKTKSPSAQLPDTTHNFYLSYLEYFVGLLLRFNAINGVSGGQVEDGEKKCSVLGRRIVCLVNELLEKTVSWR